MRPHRILGLLVGLLAILGGVPSATAPPAHACSCAPLPTAELVEGAEVVLRGRVVEIEESRFPRGDRRRAYVIEVTHSWRGTEGNPMRAHTAADGATCGFSGWQVGDDVIVAGQRRGPVDAEINLCGASGWATPEHLGEVTAALGEPEEPLPPLPVMDSKPGWLVLIASTVVLLGGAGVVVVLLLRRRAGRSA